MNEVFVILTIIALRVITNSFLLANAIGNKLLKEKKSSRWLAYWLFAFLSDVLLMLVVIAALVLIF